MQRKSTSRIFLLALLIAVLAALGVYRFWPDDSAADGPAGGASHEPVGAPAVRVARQSGAPRGNTTPNAISDDSAPSTAQPSDANQPRTLRVVTQDAAGAHVGGIGLRVYAVGVNVGGSLSGITTDPTGAIDLEFDGRVSSLRVSVDDPQWHGSGATHTGTEWPEVLVVTVNRLVSVTVSVQYEDGEPFTGRVDVFGAGGRPVRERTEDIRGGSSGWRGFTLAQSPQTIDDIQSCDTTLRFSTSRPGYLNHVHTIPASEMVEGALIQVVIPKSKQAVGDLHFVILNPEVLDEQWIIDLTHLESPGFSQERKVKRAEAEGGYTLHKLFAGPYVARVRSGSRLWLSELVITSGETTNASVTLQEAGTLTVTILDEDGVPISGGVLHMRANDLIDYPAVERIGVLAVSDRNGLARLEGCQSGEAAYVVEAFGYEPTKLQASVSPGVENNAGTVRLKRAEGSIVVTLSGGEEGRQYKVALRAPYGKGGSSTERLEYSGTVVTFAALPVREYMVYAYAAGGGTVANAHVILSPDAREAHVTMDLSSLKAHKPIK